MNVDVRALARSGRGRQFWPILGAGSLDFLMRLTGSSVGPELLIGNHFKFDSAE
jgi:hypothetical protein